MSDENIAGAKQDLISADYEQEAFFLYRSVARSLIAIAERLDSIDDALRNTIGGNPR